MQKGPKTPEALLLLVFLFLLASTAFAPCPPARAEIIETLIRVQVAGEVRHPGVYTLPVCSRVADAIQLAGGLKKGATLSGLNLSARLQDGEAITVTRETPRPTVSPVAERRTKGRHRAAARENSKNREHREKEEVRLNSATVEELDTLPGIGPGLARDIVEYRESHGRFRSLEELREVQGIGAKRFQRLSGRLRL